MAFRTLPRLIYQWALDHVSIRLRLALWYALLLAATLSLFGVLVFAVAQYQIMYSVDQSLQSNAQIVAQTVKGGLATQQASPTPTASATPAPPPTASPAPTASAGSPASPTPTETPVPPLDPQTKQAIQKQLALSDAVKDLLGRLNLTFEVVDAGKNVVYGAGNLASSPLKLDDVELRQALRHGACPAYTGDQHGSQLRIYMYPLVQAAPGQPASRATLTADGPTSCSVAQGSVVIGVVVVAKSTDDVATALSTLRRLLIAGVFVALVLSSLGAWIIAGNGLRPVASLTRTARAIAKTARGGGLGRRVGYRGPRDEVGELASTFDDMLASLEKSSIAQRRFIADAAHELRTPLTTIKGSLELLKKVPDMEEEERTAVVLDAYDEAERMAGLVNDLLLLARADAAAASKAPDDQLRGRRELVELDQLTFEVFRHGRAQLLARPDARVQLSIGTLEPLVTEGDPGQLRQLLLILLDNALKYTPAGGRVRLSMSQQDGRAAITVKDTGIGIEPEVVPHIFERFFRGDLARERDEHGGGLGLAIAQWIVEAHGGEIRVESTPGAGSTFTVLLRAVRRPGEQTSAKQPVVALPSERKRPRFGMAGAMAAPLVRLANASRPHRLKEKERRLPADRRMTPRPSNAPDRSSRRRDIRG